MHDELTKVDIQKMQEEIDYRLNTLRPKLIEDVQTARSFGDLSENFEYKAAKQAKNRNDSRIRYLQNMIATAVVIEDKHAAEEDVAGLFDFLTLWFEEDEEEQRIRLVTTLRANALEWLISKESPLGKALMGRKAGERFTVTVSESKLIFPNAFSPNGDEYNPIFKAKEYQSIVEFHAYIFNRWGQKLYDWTDPAGGWDGTYNGKDVKEGVYFLLCKAKGADGREYNIKKDVNLLRGYMETTSDN